EDTCGSCCATVRSVAQSPGSASLLENASAGLRSITPCRSLQCPPTQQPGAGSEHGSLLSGNLCLSRVNSQRKSTAKMLSSRSNEGLDAKTIAPATSYA